jgi:hypothetical protein
MMAFISVVFGSLKVEENNRSQKICMPKGIAG